MYCRVIKRCNVECCRVIKRCNVVYCKDIKSCNVVYCKDIKRCNVVYCRVIRRCNVECCVMQRSGEHWVQLGGITVHCSPEMCSFVWGSSGKVLYSTIHYSTVGNVQVRGITGHN